jgi:hypothetical protein
MAWVDWVRDSQGNVLAVPVLTWVVDPAPESLVALLRLDYGLSRDGHAQEMVQLVLTPSQLTELAQDLSEAANALSRTIDSRDLPQRLPAFGLPSLVRPGRP